MASGTAEMVGEWLGEQTARVRCGRCIFCGEPVVDCWCGEYADEPRAGGIWDDEEAPA